MEKEATLTPVLLPEPNGPKGSVKTFNHAGTFPILNQFLTDDKDTTEARTNHPSISRRALYHYDISCIIQKPHMYRKLAVMLFAIK